MARLQETTAAAPLSEGDIVRLLRAIHPALPGEETVHPRRRPVANWEIDPQTRRPVCRWVVA
jgi:hypothetical protein